MFRKTYQALRRVRRSGLAHYAASLFLLSGLLWPSQGSAQNATQASTPLSPAATAAVLPTIRVPYFPEAANPGQGAIFWLGKVAPDTNYADVRIAYDDEALLLIMHVFDRRAWYDPQAGANRDLTQYDSATLYVDAQSDLAAPLGANSRRIDGAVSYWEPRTNFQRAYTWEGGAWKVAGIDYLTESGFRANLNDSGDDRGWLMRFRVPFSSMGLSAAPPPGTVLRLALFLHDRDDPNQPPLEDQRWPPAAAAVQPSTWGRVALSMPIYTPPAVGDQQQITLRHGVDGVVAPDAGVGGGTLCGTQFDPDFFNGWGEANYASQAQINIQNQWDVADWPCFSRFYITFPLDKLPPASAVVSATLTMNMFGNAGYGPGDAKPSYMQVARVAADWDEKTVSWNSGPPVLENYGWSWVDPVDDPNDHSNRPRTWNLARAVADAHASGEPLRLVIYSTDGDYHSGKYFWSGDAGEIARPRLDITYGSPGFTVHAVPVSAMIRSGETARFELDIAALSTGEAAAIEVGASSPAGLEIAVSTREIVAPGGKTVITLTDKSGGKEARVYRVPVTVRSGGDTRTTELLVFVNGSRLFLPAVRR